MGGGLEGLVWAGEGGTWIGVDWGDGREEGHIHTVMGVRVYIYIYKYL